MRNKTTYEMDDIMGLITRDLAEKGQAPEPGGVSVRARTADGEIHPDNVEIDVNVSWIGVSVPYVSGNFTHALGHVVIPDTGAREPDDRLAAPRDLLDEAPEPGVGPAFEIGSVTSASQQLVRSTAGPFSPDKIRKRVTSLEGETTEYPGPSRTGGR